MKQDIDRLRKSCDEMVIEVTELTNGKGKASFLTLFLLLNVFLNCSTTYVLVPLGETNMDFQRMLPEIISHRGVSKFLYFM